MYTLHLARRMSDVERTALSIAWFPERLGLWRRYRISAASSG
ncbi:hypothetical protein [Agrobacterium sp.]|nr:hypothetical protein [Agrobacterium sp.]